MTDKTRSAKEVLDGLTEKDYELIGLKATIAQQAQMIEHLRAGAPNDPRLVSHAEDMSTCTLTNGDGIGYCYNRVDPGQLTAYTAVDMGTAAADGFRDGAASRDAEVEAMREDLEQAKRNPLYSTRRAAARYRHLKASWNDGGLMDRLTENTRPEDWDAAIDADMSKGAN